MPYIHCPTCGVSAYTAAAHSTTDTCPVCDTAIGNGHANGNRVEGGFGGRTLRRELAAAPASISEARHAVGDLKDELGEALHATVVLLVSELLTNSMRHSGCGDRPIELHVVVTRESVRLRVTDEGIGFRPAGRTGEDTGWGLFMVEELADRWGADARAGASVWFEIDRVGDLDEGVADLARAATAASGAGDGPASTNGKLVPPTPLR
jgi:anti-sigma regulatory factor (Ser/Thr protein kinase)